MLINVAYMLAGLAAFGATLTLPGIAGIFCTRVWHDYRVQVHKIRTVSI
jgi:hypothetical protein